MKDKLRIAKIVALALVFSLAAAFLHYHLPRTAVVTIEGTDVKWMDRSGRLSKSRDMKGGAVRDVRFINTVTREKKVLVLRNEDTGWGWPPYFKFNSSDLVAQAQAFARTEPSPTVLVTFYGWRLQLFSLYPNVVRMRAVAPDYSHFPWFNIIFLLLLVAASAYIGIKVKRLFQRIRNRFSSSKPPPSAAGADAPTEDR
ncbi:MAG: DUF1523 family protein [Desulfobacterales bacterium]|nr:DUF1523 family protein [Desulfobacterales bacterium]MDJ0855528.1 DUF1523 family protein [Desulfobacterales bacterium]MDJ0887943.1 DUF1523 family protein [Desulfobacterales bacterium]